MPRPTKAFRRQKVNAAIAYKRGNRTEAYKLWEQAAKSLKETRQQKRVRHQKKVEEPAAAEAAPEGTPEGESAGASE